MIFGIEIMINNAMSARASPSDCKVPQYYTWVAMTIIFITCSFLDVAGMTCSRSQSQNIKILYKLLGGHSVRAESRLTHNAVLIKH